jgi:uncharacterized delta-60 repeat protein
MSQRPHGAAFPFSLSLLTFLGIIVFAAILCLPARAAGLLDPSFGTNGRVNSTFDFAMRAAAIQADGKIVVIGHNTSLYVARYNADGTKDLTFGSLGRVAFSLAGSSIQAWSVAIDPTNGKIVASCDRAFEDGVVIYRLNSDGSLDTGFAGGHIIVTVPNTVGWPTSTVIRPDHSILIEATQNPFLNPVTVAFQVLDTGILDTSFGTGGFKFFSVSTSYNSLLLADGKSLVSGSGFISRLNANGSVDTSFGTAGTIPNSGGPIGFAPGGKIIGVGIVSNRPYLRRYNADGSIDATYNSITDLGLLDDLVVRSNGEAIGLRREGPLYRFASSGALIGTADLGDAFHLNLQPDGKFLTLSTGTISRYLDISNKQHIADFDGDGRSDLSVFRPSGGAWYILNSSNNSFYANQFGTAGDRIVPGDYDGDGRTDLAVFRAGTWYILGSFTSSFRAVAFGQAGDTPVAADYDGDGVTDIAVYRAGSWYVLRSLDGQMRTAGFGTATDIPVPADYDGTGAANLAVFRQSTGFWYFLSDNAGSSWYFKFGQAGDLPVPGNYQGTAKSAIAIFRPADGTWWYKDTETVDQHFLAQFGTAGDVPIPGDYDGDGRTDIGVFRNGDWYLLQTTAGAVSTHWGSPGDVAAPSGYLSY